MLRRIFMTPNLAWWDRAIRVIPALVALWLYSQGLMSGPWAIVLDVVAVVLLYTAVTTMCPIYGLFGWSTRSRDQRRQAHS